MHKVKTLSCLLLALLLTGCTSAESVPELIEPLSQTASYRPVQYADVSSYEIYNAEIVPEEYPVFLEDNVVVTEFLCDIGDTVKKGQKLAVVDNTSLEEQLEDLKSDLKYLNKIHELENRIQAYDINLYNNRAEDSSDEISNLKSQLSSAGYAESHGGKNPDGSTYTGLSSGEIEAQISMLEEIKSTSDYIKSITSVNNEYDNRDYNTQLQSIQNKISDIEKKIADTAIIAPCDGVVTSLTPTDNFGRFSAYENLVIISDLNTLHVELEMSLNDSAYKVLKAKNYAHTTISVDGKSYELSVKDFSNDEKIAMEKRYIYPNARYEFTGEVPVVKAGQKVIVRFENNAAEKKLCVTTDSVVAEGDQSFVYVKTDDGREKREIITGATANGFIEVVSGLTEGELVYYTQNIVIPNNYEEYTVTASDFVQTSSDYMAHPFYVYTRKQTISYSHESVVSKIYVKRDDTVKKGDLLCTLTTSAGTAKIVELQTRLKRLQENIFWNDYENSKITDENPYNPVPGYNREIVKLRYEQQLENLTRQLERAKKINDGSGQINIYAPCDGVIGQMNVEVNNSITEGKETKICTINDSSSKKVAFNTKDYHAGYGNEAILDFGGETLTVSVIGDSGRNGTGYLSYYDGKYFSTKGTSSKQSYIDVNTALPGGNTLNDVIMSNIDITFTIASTSNALLIPSGALYKEAKSYNANVISYYVWLITDEGLVKQPVTVYGAQDTNGRYMILRGLNPGDVIAVKKGDNKG